jgi:hypothetical protein
VIGYPRTYFYEINFIITVHFTSRFPSEFSSKTLYVFLIFSNPT